MLFKLFSKNISISANILTSRSINEEQNDTVVFEDLFKNINDYWNDDIIQFVNFISINNDGQDSKFEKPFWRTLKMEIGKAISANNFHLENFMYYDDFRKIKRIHDTCEYSNIVSE